MSALGSACRSRCSGGSVNRPHAAHRAATTLDGSSQFLPGRANPAIDLPSRTNRILQNVLPLSLMAFMDKMVKETGLPEPASF